VLILKLPAPLTIGLILILDLTINLILELALRISKSDLNENENKNSLIKLIINGILTGIILSMLFIWNLIRYGWNPGEQIKNTDTAFIKSTTIVFLLLAIIQILKTYNIKEKKNIYTILTMIISVMILYILMEFPIVQDALKLTNLSKIEWQIIGFLTIVILIIHETTKLTFRNKKNEI
jgi:magnesium-transporting ATPase (P-type)